MVRFSWVRIVMVALIASAFGCGKVAETLDLDVAQVLDVLADPGTTDDPGVVNDLGETDPGDSDPGDTDSGTTDSGAIDSGTTDSGTTDSGTTDPGTTDSGTTDSGTTDSGTTDSGTTDPGEADPGSTTHTGTGGCASLFPCFLGCESGGSCEDECFDDASLAAGEMLREVLDCMEENCDHIEDETEWMVCALAATDAGGACEAKMTACMADEGNPGLFTPASAATADPGAGCCVAGTPTLQSPVTRQAQSRLHPAPCSRAVSAVSRRRSVNNPGLLPEE